MEEAWSPEALEIGLNKLAVNSMIGIWAMNVNCEALSAVTGYDADGPGSWAVREFAVDGATLYDHIYRVSLLDNTSWRPIHDFVLASEHVWVAKMRDEVQKLPCRILDIKTDALNISCSAKSAQKLEVAFSGEVYRTKPLGKRLQGSYRPPQRVAPPICKSSCWRDSSQETSGRARLKQHGIQTPSRLMNPGLFGT
jgi:hypothetical protein